jgi:hypothetical protein
MRSLPTEGRQDLVAKLFTQERNFLQIAGSSPV